MSITMKEHKAKVNPLTHPNALYLKKCYIIKKTRLFKYKLQTRAFIRKKPMCNARGV